MNTPHQASPPASPPATPLAALAKRWYWGAGLGLLGLVAGAGVSLLSPVTYVGESRVSVGSQSLDARVVAGYSIASQQLAADLSRYVNDQQAQGTLRPTLGARASKITTVAASPIPSSSVIRVEVTGTDGAAAAAGATAVANSLAKQVNGLTSTAPADLLAQYTALSQQVAQQEGALQTAQSNLGAAQGDRRSTPEAIAAAVQQVNGLTSTAPQDLLAQYTALSQQVAQQQSALQTAQSDLGAAQGARTTTPEEVAAVQQRVTDAESALAVLEVQQSALGTRYKNAVTSTPAAAGLQVIERGTVTSDDRRSEALRYGLAGLGGGLVVALGLATLSDRRRTRRHPDDDQPDAPAATSHVNVREHVTGH